jgi:hypothetical protein
MCTLTQPDNTSTGLGAFGVDPPSGSVVANFEGTLNATTINCSVTNTQGARITTQWTLTNFGRSDAFFTPNNVAPELFSFSGDPIPGFDLTYQNSLTVTNLTNDLDGVIIYCGTGLQSQQANFTLRIYRKLSENCMEIFSYVIKLDIHA